MVKQLAETRVRISLNDELSTGLSKAQRNVAGFNKSITATSGAFGGVVSNITGLTAALTGLYGAIDLTAQAIKAPFDFAKSMETNKLGIAGIMQSMLQLNGRTLQWQESLALSDKVITKLNENALKTAATSKDLVEAFRALLGPGIAAGMSMKEIVEYSTVGANAVKSLGLERQQVVQEIRDLVQGGIRAQSSTLAVSLGLTDKDIAEAKKSSEGLYNFLMKRLEGFKMSARETPKTMAGLLDQIEEGYTRSTATGAEPLYEYYKDVLGRVSELFLDSQSFQLNQDYIDSVREFSEHAVNAAEGLETAGRVIGTVISPAVDLAGSTMGVLADNTDKVVLGFAGLKAGQIAVDLYKVANASKDTYEAQTTLGGVLQKGKSYFTSYGAAAELAARKEIENALAVTQTIKLAEKEKRAEIKKTKMMEEAFLKIAREKKWDLAFRLKFSGTHYQNAGVDAKTAEKLQMQASEAALRGNFKLTEQILSLQEAHVKNAEAKGKEAEALSKLQSRVLQVGSTISGLSGAYLMLAEDTESFGYKMAESTFAVGAGIDAIGLLIGELGKLKTAYDAVKTAGAAAGILQLGSVVGTGALAIGAVVGGATAGIYALANGVSAEEAYRRYFEGFRPGHEADMSAVIAHKRRVKDGKINENDLSPKFTKEQLDALNRAREKIDLLGADLDIKIKGYTDSSLAVANARVTKEITRMNATLDKARAAGVSEAEISKIEADIKRYRKLANEQNARNYLTEEHNMQMNLLQAMEDTYAEHYSVIDKMRAEEAESYRQRLLEELQNTELTEKEKLRLRQEYANATEQINKAQSTNLDAAFKQSLDYLKNVQYDQVATVKSGIDEMLGAITNFGQNMLIEQKSFSDRSDELFKDLANSIINTMMKVIMQGLVMNSIMSIFNLGGGGGKTISLESLTGQKGVLSTLPHRANGGLANGWTVVGERGPELAHFGQPARIYTAEQTAKALKGNGGDVNVKINMVNQSGQQLQVEQTGGGFDGESYIVNVVINAVANNKNGMRTILKGAMAR